MPAADSTRRCAGAERRRASVDVAIERGELRVEDIYAELGEIAAGLKPGRQHENEITYFKSVGNAAQDAAVAQAIYQTALKNNLGQMFDMMN